MTDKEMLQLVRLIAQYANEYETVGGRMTLRELIEDAETSMDEDYNCHKVTEIANSIRWS
jgi:hypothetical protein